MGKELHELAKEIFNTIMEEDLYYESLHNGGYRKTGKAKDFRCKNDSGRYV